MSHYAKKGSESECVAFSAGTTSETEGWWFQGGTLKQCQSILASDSPFRDNPHGLVDFSSDPGGCRHKADHTHVIRARVNVRYSDEYSLEDNSGNGLIRQGEVWLKVKNADRIKLDQDFLQEI